MRDTSYTPSLLENAAARWDGEASSAAAWMGAGLLALALFVNEAVFRVIDVETFTFDWQVGLRLAVCIACGVYGLLQLPHTQGDFGWGASIWVVLFGLWALMTAPLALHSAHALGAAVALWCMILFVPGVLRQLTGPQVLLVIVGTLSAFVAVSWVTYFAVPQLGRTEFVTADLEVRYRLGGLAHANALGRVTALLIAVLWVAGLQRCLRWRSVLLLLGLAVVTLIATDCRTAMIAAAATTVLIVLRRFPAGWVLFVALTVAILALSAGLAVSLGLFEVDADALFARLSRGGTAEGIYTLTGRVHIWQFVAEKIRQSPLVGYGYGCTRFVLTGSEHLAVYHAHNQLLNVVLSVGLVGGLLLVAMFVTQLGSWVVRPQTFPDAVLVLVIVGGLADNMVFTPIPDACTLVWLIALFWRTTGRSVGDGIARDSKLVA
jgi:exopolysaccharide production protein ExoQ